MGIIRDIAAMLWPDKPAPVPAIVKTKDKKQDKRQDNTQRLVPIAGRLFVDDLDNKDKNGDIEFELSYTRADIDNSWGQRQDNLTDDDIEELESRGLAGNLEKAAELKALWASGMSAGEMCRFFQGRWGYGERTMKSYVAAFNASSPGGGASANTGAK